MSNLHTHYRFKLEFQRLTNIQGSHNHGTVWYMAATYHIRLTVMVVDLDHNNNVIMGAIASQITSLTSIFLTVYSGADQRKHQSYASLAFVGGIYRWPVNSPHKWPVTREMFLFNDAIMPSRHWSDHFQSRVLWRPKRSVCNYNFVAPYHIRIFADLSDWKSPYHE